MINKWGLSQFRQTKILGNVKDPGTEPLLKSEIVCISFPKLCCFRDARNVSAAGCLCNLSMILCLLALWFEGSVLDRVMCYVQTIHDVEVFCFMWYITYLCKMWIGIVTLKLAVFNYNVIYIPQFQRHIDMDCVTVLFLLRARRDTELFY